LSAPRAPKIKVKPNYREASLLRGLFELEKMAVVNRTRRNRWWSLDGSYTGELKAQKQFGSPTSATIKSCLSETWIQVVEGSWAEDIFVLSELGTEIARSLARDDLVPVAKVGMTTRQVIEVLRTGHPYPTWLFAVEVRLGTGFGVQYHLSGHPKPVYGDQRIDAFAMHTWPSKKFKRIAYEIKVSKADFQNELKHPDKRLAAEMFANLTYFAAPIGIIKPEQVPDGWGLIEIVGDGMYDRTLEATWRDIGKDLPASFIASFGRSLMAA